MNGKQIFGRLVSGLVLGMVLLSTLAVSSVAPALAAAPRVPQAPQSAPLKPDWVEALLDERATAIGSLGAAHDLLSAQHTISAAAIATQREIGAAPLKPDWVEALLDARATANRALLSARDIAAVRAER